MASHLADRGQDGSEMAPPKAAAAAGKMQTRAVGAAAAVVDRAVAQRNFRNAAAAQAAAQLAAHPERARAAAFRRHAARAASGRPTRFGEKASRRSPSSPCVHGMSPPQLRAARRECAGYRGSPSLHERLAGQGRSGEIRGERQILRASALRVEPVSPSTTKPQTEPDSPARPQPSEQAERRLIHPGGACIGAQQNTRAAQVTPVHCGPDGRTAPSRSRLSGAARTTADESQRLRHHGRRPPAQPRAPDAGKQRGVERLTALQRSERRQRAAARRATHRRAAERHHTAARAQETECSRRQRRGRGEIRLEAERPHLEIGMHARSVSRAEIASLYAAGSFAATSPPP